MNALHTWHIPAAFAALLILAPACSVSEEESSNEEVSILEDMGALPEDMPATTDPDLPQTQPLTYYADVKPIVHSACESCHVKDGAGPYQLDTYDTLKQYAPLALSTIERGEMPPWSPDPECRNFKGERLIAPEEVETLRQWIDEGMAEGNPDDWQTPPSGGMSLEAADIVGQTSGAYTPRETPADDYQCFLIDTTFEQDTFVVGTNVIPDNDQLVHHANLFLISPSFVPQVEELEGREPDAGYSCFGDAGINQTSIIGAWVPGAQPIFTPDDAAIIIPKGSRLVLQTHFNSEYTLPEPVAPEVHLYTRDEPPAQRARALPMANLTFEVPPGEKESVHEIVITNSSRNPWTIIGTAPHAHLLASQIKVEVERKDDEMEDTCLVDIPEWDFNWQQEYRFLDDEWVSVRPGDSVRMTCVYDNSPENQPIIDGERVAPQQVGWGGKTRDEMCLNFLVMLEEYDTDAAQQPLCSEFKTCRSECDDPFAVGCIFNCATEESTCGECLLFGAQDCSFKYCRGQTRAATPCLLACAQGAQAGGDIDACLRQECPTEYTELETCLRPYIEQGLCNQYIDACNVEF